MPRAAYNRRAKPAGVPTMYQDPTTDAPEARTFHHRAVFYADEDEFLAATAAFLRAGLEAEEPAFVAVNEHKIELLKSALGGDAYMVKFVDMEFVGRNPARIIPIWREFIEECGGEDQPVRGIGEPIWPGRSPDELIECEHHESLLNLAFADSPAWSLLCPYDRANLGEEVLETAKRTHPHIGENGAHEASPHYAEPATAPLADPLPEPGAMPRELGFIGSASLAFLRDFIGESAHGTTLSGGRKNDFVLAVNEVATNSVRHAGGHGTLRVWIEDDTLLCDVHDEGRIEQALVGRARPKPDAMAGRGLWVANQLCDLVQIRSNDEGTTVRLHMRIAERLTDPPRSIVPGAVRS